MDREDITRRFTFHPATQNQTEFYHLIREKARSIAHTIEDFVPDSREKALAIDKLDQMVMWANAAVARHT